MTKRIATLAQGLEVASAEVLAALGALVSAIVIMWRIGRDDSLKVRAEMQVKIDKMEERYEARGVALVAALEKNAELRARVAALEEQRDERRPDER